MPETKTITESDQLFDPRKLTIDHIDGRRTTINPKTIVASAVQHENDAIYIRLDDQNNPEFWFTMVVSLTY